jgi:polar amino acid transport system substrate-binding protein/glutamate/aspartate transport system substrate-binding protein
MRIHPPTVVALLVAALLAAPALAAPTLDQIRERGQIVLAYRDAAEPFSFRDRQGRVRGYSVELCARVAAAIQKELQLPELKVEWLAVDAADRFDAVAGGKADLECGTSTITLTRMQKVDFSLPIFVDGGSALVRAKANVARVTDLKGKRIAVIPGTTTERALTRALSAQGATATLVPVKTGPDGISALAQGRADAYAGDRVVLAGLKLRAADPALFEFIGDDFSFEPYALVLRRDDPDFRLAVNRALAGLYRDGAVDPIFQRWLAPLGKPGPLLHAMFYLNALPD